MNALLHFAVRILLLLLTGVIVMIYLTQERYLYHPSRYPETPQAAAIPMLQEVAFQTDQGPQFAYFFPGRRGTDFVWFMFNGNASLALHFLDFVQRFPDDRTGFFLVEYPGYGRNAGTPSSEAIRENSEQVFRRAADLLERSPEELRKRSGAVGYSLGAAAALQLAARHGIARLVLVAPFTSIRDMARVGFGVPLCYLSRKHFDNREELLTLKNAAPDLQLMVMHGERDEVIPVAMGRELAELGGGLFRWYPEESHGTIWHSRAAVIAAEMVRMSRTAPADGPP